MKTKITSIRSGDHVIVVTKVISEKEFFELQRSRVISQERETTQVDRIEISDDDILKSRRWIDFNFKLALCSSLGWWSCCNQHTFSRKTHSMTVRTAFQFRSTHLFESPHFLKTAKDLQFVKRAWFWRCGFLITNCCYNEHNVHTTCFLVSCTQFPTSNSQCSILTIQFQFQHGLSTFTLQYSILERCPDRTFPCPHNWTCVCFDFNFSQNQTCKVIFQTGWQNWISTTRHHSTMTILQPVFMSGFGKKKSV